MTKKFFIDINPDAPEWIDADNAVQFTSEAIESLARSASGKALIINANPRERIGVIRNAQIKEDLPDFPKMDDNSVFIEFDVELENEWANIQDPRPVLCSVILIFEIIKSYPGEIDGVYVKKIGDAKIESISIPPVGFSTRMKLRTEEALD